MSFDHGLFVRKTTVGVVATGVVNLSTGHISEIRVHQSAEAALIDVEQRAQSAEFPYEGTAISGFAPEGPNWTVGLNMLELDNDIQHQRFQPG